MNVNEYLRRIGIDKVEEANEKTLAHLQLQHMLHIPFENLDVMRNVPIPLDVTTYYEKVVSNHRGGFCYELNGLFNWLLHNVGFTNHLVAGTVRRPDGGWAKEGSHAAQIVELDQPYLVDVGFGDSARVPIPLTGELREDVSGVYRAVQVKDHIFDLQRADGDANYNTLLRFDITPKELPDFEEVCRFNQTSPESHFTQKELVTIATPDGRITLSDNHLITTRNGEKQKATVSEDEKPAILQQFFGIHLK